MSEPTYLDIVNQAALLSEDEFKRASWHRCGKPKCENIIHAQPYFDMSGRYVLYFYCDECRGKWIRSHEYKLADAEAAKSKRKQSKNKDAI